MVWSSSGLGAEVSSQASSVIGAGSRAKIWSAPRRSASEWGAGSTAGASASAGLGARMQVLASPSGSVQVQRGPGQRAGRRRMRDLRIRASRLGLPVQWSVGPVRGVVWRPCAPGSGPAAAPAVRPARRGCGSGVSGWRDRRPARGVDHVDPGDRPTVPLFADTPGRPVRPRRTERGGRSRGRSRPASGCVAANRFLALYSLLLFCILDA